MYFYCYSFGEYERYTEYMYFHEKKFTEEEFVKMVKDVKYDDDKLLEKYGFKKVTPTVHYHFD